jgi:diguanylate cyclase (GGDEF)-like protein
MIIECGTHSATGPTYCSGTKDRCHIVVPLKSHSNVIGILSLHTPTSLQIGTQEDMLLTISNQLGLAISNIKLFMEAQKHSLIDPLTGLGNRRNLSAHMTRFISEARRHKTPLSLAMADIDHFKRFNDTFGHAKGDEILTKVSQIIKNEIRDIDFVARYGGEEFLILFSKTGLSGAQQACERIRKTVEVDTDVTISIGIASFSLGGTENELMEEADKALYMAKENGRNRVEVAQKS